MAVEFSNVSIKNITTNSNTVIGPGENFVITFTCKNNTQNNINTIQVLLNDYSNVYSASTYLYADNVTAKLPVGATATFSVSGKALTSNESVLGLNNIFTYLVSNNRRGTVNSLQIKYTVDFYSSGGTPVSPQQTTVSLSPSMNVISRRINPKISNVAFKRYNSTSGTVADDGEKVLTTLKTSFSNASDYNYFTLTIEQRTTANDTLIGTKAFSPQNSSDLSTLQQIASTNGIIDSTLLINTFTLNANTNYRMKIIIADSYESNTVYYMVPASFVNVHLSSAQNGGVAFGKFSEATSANPLFECNYPAILYNNTEVKGGLEVYWSIVTTHGGIGTDSGNIIAGGTGNVQSTGGNVIATVGNVTAGNDVSAGRDISATRNISTGGSITAGNGLTVNSSNGGTVQLNSNTVITGDLTVSGDVNIKKRIPIFKYGTENFNSVPAMGSSSVLINFDSGFASVPHVVVCFYDTGNTNIGRMSCCVSSVNENQLGITVWNGGSDAHSCSVNWLAYGEVS